MLTAQETAVRRFYSRRSRICVEHSQFVEHRNKHRPREVSLSANGRYGSLTTSKVDLTEQRAAQSARLAVRVPVAISPDSARDAADHRVLYILGFGIAGAIVTNGLVFIYFVLFYASGLIDHPPCARSRYHSITSPNCAAFATASVRLSASSLARIAAT
jgi:hypothetical protein